MALTPAFELGLCNGWLFMMVFLLQWLAVSFSPAVSSPGRAIRPISGKAAGRRS